MTEAVLKLKACVIGDVAVGKSAISYRFRSGGAGALPLSRPTTYCENTAVHFDELDGPRVVVSINDCAGQEKVMMSAVSRSVFRDSHVVFLVYAIDSRPSFEKLATWLAHVEEHVAKNCVFVVVGNKSDLEDEREVSKSEVDAWAKQRQYAFFEVSAKEYVNVEKAFHFAVREAVKRQQEARQQSGASPVQQPPSFNLRQQAPAGSQQPQKKKEGCSC